MNSFWKALYQLQWYRKMFFWMYWARIEGNWMWHKQWTPATILQPRQKLEDIQGPHVRMIILCSCHNILNYSGSHIRTHVYKDYQFEEYRCTCCGQLKCYWVDAFATEVYHISENPGDELTSYEKYSLTQTNSKYLTCPDCHDTLYNRPRSGNPTYHDCNNPKCEAAYSILGKDSMKRLTNRKMYLTWVEKKHQWIALPGSVDKGVRIAHPFFIVQ